MSLLYLFSRVVSWWKIQDLNTSFLTLILGSLPIVLGLTELCAPSIISSSQSFLETEEKNMGPDPDLLLASRLTLSSTTEFSFSLVNLEVSYHQPRMYIV